MKKIKIGDSVKIIQGKNRGQIGIITLILHNKKKIVIDGINKKFKYVKSIKNNKIGQPKMFNTPLDISNVMLCNSNGLISKIGFIIKNNIKVRVLKKTNELLK